jgi:hypothetical protein
MAPLLLWEMLAVTRGSTPSQLPPPTPLPPPWLGIGSVTPQQGIHQAKLAQ